MCAHCGLDHTEPLLERSFASRIEAHGILGVPESGGVFIVTHNFLKSVFSAQGETLNRSSLKLFLNHTSTCSKMSVQGFLWLRHER